MFDPLQAQIDEARRAADALAEQERLKAKAAELEPLLQEQLKREQAQQATIQLEAALDDLAQRLESLTPKAEDFQKRFTALKAEAEALQATYAELNAERTAIRGELTRATGEWQRANSRQVWVGNRPEWTQPIHPTADRLALQAKQLLLFPAGVSPYSTGKGYDPLAAAIAGKDTRPPSWRTR